MTAVFYKCEPQPVQGAEKTIISKMLVGGSDKRTYAIDRHAGVVSSQCAMYKT